MPMLNALWASTMAWAWAWHKITQNQLSGIAWQQIKEMLMQNTFLALIARMVLAQRKMKQRPPSGIGKLPSKVMLMLKTSWATAMPMAGAWRRILPRLTNGIVSLLAIMARRRDYTGTNSRNSKKISTVKELSAHYVLNCITASTQRPQMVGCSGFEPTSVSQCQQRSHFWPSALEIEIETDLPTVIFNADTLTSSRSNSESDNCH